MQSILIVPWFTNINRIYKWGVLKKNYCYECANDMLAIHYIGDIRELPYENGNKVCIKAFALNFIDATVF